MVQITREHGQRLFSNLWTAGRVSFEFEEMSVFPDYASNFPPAQDDPDNWVLGSLRQVRFDSLMPSQRPDPNGSPAYTRKGLRADPKAQAQRRRGALRHGDQRLGITHSNREKNRHPAQ